MRLAGWGRVPFIEARLLKARYAEEIPILISESRHRIVRGNGRSYGDAAVCADLTMDLRSMDRILAFDKQNGLLTCEPGLLLKDLLAVLIPQGWFMPVVPGTSLVTVGGMAASDVHGKNHHRDGAFSRYVEELELIDGDGAARTCSRFSYPDLFEATLGGMGLTGVITRLTLRLKRISSPWVDEQVKVANSLTEAFDLFDDAAEHPYSVAWIDGLAGGRRLGRSLLFLGRHAEAEPVDGDRAIQKIHALAPRVRNVPPICPRQVLNRYTVKAFNTAYYWRGVTSPAYRRVNLYRYFFPLDSLANWNRLYGARGFYQFQAVLPLESSKSGLSKMLEQTSRRGAGSMLAVLKRLGAAAGPLSFPMPGYTLAMDFPNTTANQRLIGELEAICNDHGGRIYLAKDACASPAGILQGYPRLNQFMDVRARYGATGFRSALSDRLEIT